MKRAFFLLCIGFLLTHAAVVHAAVFDISMESSGSPRVGDEFAVDVLIDAEEQAINAVAANISYDSEALEIISVSKSGSIINLWIEDPLIQKSIGLVSFAGLIPGGFSGVKSPFYEGGRPGRLVRLVFVARRAGPTAISIVSPKVLLHDGKGTEIRIGGRNSTSVSILPANVMIPKVVMEDPSGTQPDFELNVAKSALIGEGKWFVTFGLTDPNDLHGHFELAENPMQNPSMVSGFNWKQVTSPAILSDQARGSYIHIRWVSSGSEPMQIMKTIPPERGYVPSRFSPIWVILIFVILIILSRFIKRRTALGGTSLFLGVFFLSCIAPVSLHAADLTVYPSIGSYALNKPFTVDLMVDNSRTSINAVSGTLSFPSELVTVTGIIKDGSIIKLWASEPVFSNSNGTVRFEGVIFNPGYAGEKGKVLTVQFTPKKVGISKLAFTDGSILANDGRGTNVLQQLGTASFALVTKTDEVSGLTTTPAADPLAPAAPKIFSRTHESPDRWYSNVSPSFAWSLPNDVTAVRVSYDKNQSSIPKTLYEPPISKKTYENISDGIYYLHVQLRNSHGWGAISHFRFQIDTMAPAAFKITFPHGATGDNPQPIIYFNTPDGLSGIDHYEVKIGDNDLLSYAPEALSNPYVMPPQDFGKHTVLVRAIDKAGNVTTESVDFEVESIVLPVLTNYPTDLTEGDIFKVRGTTYPNTSLDFFMRNERGEVVSTEFTKSNVLGDFAVVWSKKLDYGVYTLTLQATDARGAKSSQTQPVTITIHQKILFKIGALAVNYASLAVIVLVGISIIAGIIWYILHLFSILKRKINKDIAGMENVIHKEMHSLREDVEDQLKVLENIRTKRDLTKEEAVIIKVFRKRLAATENIIKGTVQKIKKDVS